MFPAGRAVCRPHHRMASDFTAAMRKRGLLEQMTGGFKDAVAAPSCAYVGFDPTAPSLHVGNLISIVALAHLQRAGHTPVALIGGATALIGDPSGRFEERTLMDTEEVEANAARIGSLLKRMLDIGTGTAGSGKLVNNADWYHGMLAMDLLRDIGKSFSVSKMLGRESVKTRLDSGLSFTEFSYQILQAYDFVHLSRTENCRIQCGGSDQWGNIVGGIELARRLDGTACSGFTVPLLTDSTGKKIGKSTGGEAVWLDEGSTSHFDFYQHFWRTHDVDVPRYLGAFTILSEQELEEAIHEHAKDPGRRLAHELLASSVTRFVRGDEGLQVAKAGTKALYGGGSLDGLSTAEVISLFKGGSHVSLPCDDVVGTSVVDLAVRCGASNTAELAKQLVQQGGLYLNNQRVTETDRVIGTDEVIGQGLVVLRVGKRTNYLVSLD